MAIFGNKVDVDSILEDIEEIESLLEMIKLFEDSGLI